jgi:hypothetical protein
LNLVLHFQAEPMSDANAATQRNLALATALLGAHPELRQGFDNVWIFADGSGVNPFVTQRPMTDVAAAK